MENINVASTMRDYLKVIFRRKFVVITAFITVMTVVSIGAQFITPVYEAKVKMLISAEKPVESPYYREIIGSLKAEASLTQSEIVTSNPVIENVVNAVGLYKRPFNYEEQFASPLKKPLIAFGAKSLEKELSLFPEEQRQSYVFRMMLKDLKSHIKVQPIMQTDLFTISVQDYSPVGAAILANVVSRSYIIFDLQQQLAELQLKYGEKHLSVIQLRDNIEKMSKSLNGEPLPNVEAIGPASVKVIEQASIPSRPTGIPAVLIILLAFPVSICLGVMLAFMFEYLDQTLKSPQDIESFLNLPYLGSIAKKANTGDYRDLADQIYLLMKDKNIKSLLIDSAREESKVTPIIMNLGAYLAKTAGHKVLIIDANLRNPSLHKFLKSAENTSGLSDILEGKASFDKAVKDLGQKLFLLNAGKTALNPIILLDSHIMREVIQQAKEKFELILIDCSGLNEFRDGVALSAHTDGVVLVVNEGRTRRQVAKAAISPLEQKKVNLIGVILNNRTFPIPKGIYKRL